MNGHYHLATGGRFSVPSDNQSVDQALRKFFRHEMPDPWPACRATAAIELRKPAPGFRDLAKRYLALALSILFLMMGLSMASDWLSGRSHRDAGNITDSIDNTAQPRDLHGNPKRTLPPAPPRK